MTDPGLVNVIDLPTTVATEALPLDAGEFAYRKKMRFTASRDQATSQHWLFTTIDGDVDAGRHIQFSHR